MSKTIRKEYIFLDEKTFVIWSYKNYGFFEGYMFTSPLKFPIKPGSAPDTFTYIGVL